MTSRVLIAAGALAATAALTAIPTAGASACGTVKLTAAASGRTVPLKPCQKLVISLSQSSDGGYLWRVATRPKASVLTLASTSTIRPAQPPGVVGGSTTKVYVYRAVGRGRTSLRLVESRSFQRGSTIKTFTAKITVT